MFKTWMLPRLADFFRAERRPGTARTRRHVRAYRPRLETLEDRAVPATVTWDGLGRTENWTDRFNWVGDVCPLPGDDLVFPANALRLNNVNNYLDHTEFHSLQFTTSGYTISAGPLNNTTDFDAIYNAARSGTNRYNGALQTDHDLFFDLAAGGTLEIGGDISGSGGIGKSGLGTLILSGTSANTYTGGTDVAQGLLQLDKVSKDSDVVAIPGTLSISEAGKVQLLHSNQIASNAPVLFFRRIDEPLLDLNGFSQAVGPLTFHGGAIQAGSGHLALNGDVTVEFPPSEDLSPATITGNVSLGSTRTITIDETRGALGLKIDGNIGGSVLIKEGLGQLSLAGDAVLSNDVEVNSGNLIVNGTVTTGSGAVVLRNDAFLGGSGTVSAVSTDSGAGKTIDDGASGFSATSNWSTVTSALGFGGDYHRVIPAAGSPISSASWTFTGLTTGLYNVFATWPGDPNNTTAAPFDLSDLHFQLSSTVNQERAPVAGPKVGNYIFQKLVLPEFPSYNGAFKVTSDTLKVSLTNDVALEVGGATVIADAVRIERAAGILSPSGPSGPVSTLHLGSASLGVGSTCRIDFVNRGFVNVTDQLNVDGNLAVNGALLVLSGSFTPPIQGTAYRIINTGSLTGTFANGDTVQLVDADNGQRHIFTINYGAGDGTDVDLVYTNTATKARDLEVSPDVIEEGGRVTLRGALTDPNPGDVLSLRVDWGDGSSQTFTDLGTKPFHFDHTYADNSPAGAPYLVRAEWFDQHGDGNFRKLFVTVNNVPPRLFLGGAEVIRAGEVMQHTATFTDLGADTFTATVDYGDGAGPQPLAIQPGQTLFFDHPYTKPGKYRVTVTVLDDDGGLSTDTFLVIVLPSWDLGPI
jgi:autotransporter-associated beta strand protein